MIDDTSPEEWVSAMVRGAQQRATQVTTVIEALHQRTFTARSQDRSIAVTVDHGGTVTAIAMTDAVRDRDPVRLSSELMDCIRRAGTLAAAAVEDAMRPVLADSPETLAAVRASAEQRIAPAQPVERPQQGWRAAPPRRQPPPDPDGDLGDRSWMRRD